ncbi:MAG: Sec-independent protein translocase subunit TatA/TatB [Ilumatobacteraceae bacterium]
MSGTEIVVILLLALVVLGPEKLPDAIRKFGRTYAELKKMGTGFQQEFKSAIDEPVREMRETADLLKKSADFSSAGPKIDPAKAAAADGAKPEPTAADPEKSDAATTDAATTDPVTTATAEPATDEPVDEVEQRAAAESSTDAASSEPGGADDA